MAPSTTPRQSGVESVDLTETRTFVLGIVQVILTAIAFGLMFYLVAATRIAPLGSTPESATFAVLLGSIPAVILGAGVPYLVQRREYFNRLNDSTGARVVGTTVTFGTYFVLFFYHPVTSVLYAIVYLLSRVAILVGIYGVSRIKATLA
ncbi:hypothetical protein SAMN05216559_1941 [Halomicrobium zhouii]|uniref:DUF8100 domain-containing protein n=1 Tax=Halomicrobium zhouii TaxID=767519 RepID=A0A1I6L3U3_9EURY|nr:hypothetical protein [Halomicrobium zhouii]SFR97930.1 hypothetical protein SAMN05216559_1941 [Halomicrobium zhouii]